MLRKVLNRIGVAVAKRVYVYRVEVSLRRMVVCVKRGRGDVGIGRITTERVRQHDGVLLCDDGERMYAYQAVG
jgi:hypothetical protein